MIKSKKLICLLSFGLFLTFIVPNYVFAKETIKDIKINLTREYVIEGSLEYTGDYELKTDLFTASVNKDSNYTIQEEQIQGNGLIVSSLKDVNETNNTGNVLLKSITLDDDYEYIVTIKAKDGYEFKGEYNVCVNGNDIMSSGVDEATDTVTFSLIWDLDVWDGKVTKIDELSGLYLYDNYYIIGDSLYYFGNTLFGYPYKILDEYMENGDDIIDASNYDSKKLKAGKYQYHGIAVPLDERYEFANEVKIEVNGEYIKLKPVDGKIDLFGLQTFYVREEKEIDEIVIDNINFDLVIGKKPIFTAKYDENKIIVTEAFTEDKENGKTNGYNAYYFQGESSSGLGDSSEDEEDLSFELVEKDTDYIYSLIVQTNFYNKEYAYIFTDTPKVILNGSVIDAEFKAAEVTGDTDEESASSFNKYMKYIINIKKVTPREENDREKSESDAIKDITEQILNDIKNGVEIKGLSEELIDTIKNAPEGSDIKFEVRTPSLSVTNYEEDVNKINEVSENILGYYNIEVVVTINGNDAGNVTELKKTIQITLPKVSNTTEVKEGYTRTYYVIRVHDGKAEKLVATLNEDGTISFESDKFSSYAIAYEDVANKVDEEIENPNTLDNINISIILLVISISIMTTIGLIYKKNN